MNSNGEKRKRASAKSASPRFRISGESSEEKIVEADTEAPPSLDLLIKRRKNPPAKAQTYMLESGKYLVGCSVARSPDHSDVIDKIAEELKKGLLRPLKAACLSRLSELA